MHTTSFIQYIVLIFLLFLLFGDSKKINMIYEFLKKKSKQ